MEFTLRWILTCFALESLHIQASNGQALSGPQLYLDSFKGDTVSVVENKNLNLTFWIDASSCKDPAALFRLEVQTKRSDGTYDNDGRVVRYKNKCEVTFNNLVHCISDDGPAQLYKTVNRSHKEVVWTMSWIDEDSKTLVTRQKRMKLNIFVLSSISQSNRPLANQSGISSTGLNVSTRSQDEQVICELKSDGSCIQNVTLRGVHNSTFDVVYLYPNDTKSVVVGCDLFKNGEFICKYSRVRVTDSKIGNLVVFASSANTCLEKDFLYFTCGNTTVECKEEEKSCETVVLEETDTTTLSPERHSDDVSTVAVTVTIGVILAIFISVVIGILLYKKFCKKGVCKQPLYEMQRLTEKGRIEEE